MTPMNGIVLEPVSRWVEVSNWNFGGGWQERNTEKFNGFTRYTIGNSIYVSMLISKYLFVLLFRFYLK